MKEDVPRDETGIEMGQAPFESFFEDFFSAEIKAKKLAEKISEYKIGNCQDSNGLVEKKHS